MVRSEIQNVKLRFGIIGNAEGLNRAIDVAIQVAPTDLSVLDAGYPSHATGPLVTVTAGTSSGDDPAARMGNPQ